VIETRCWNVTLNRTNIAQSVKDFLVTKTFCAIKHFGFPLKTIPLGEIFLNHSMDLKENGFVTQKEKYIN